MSYLYIFIVILIISIVEGVRVGIEKPKDDDSENKKS